MIWHPLFLAIAMVDALSLLFVSKAAITAVRVVADWSPGAATRRQIALETAAETGVLSARAAFALIALSTVLLVTAVTNAFPDLVPGAMCGTGVLQATRGAGAQAFFFKLLCLGVFYLWFIVDRLDRSFPDAPLARLAAKMLLLAAPVAVLSVFATVNALTRLDAHTPVDCCAMVYDQFTGARGATLTGAQSDVQLVRVFALLTFCLAASGVAGLLTKKARFGISSTAAAILAPVWGLLSGFVLVRIFSAYTYEVLHHHCPWCLFLPEYRYVGFALFGFLGQAVIQGPAAWLAWRATRAHPALAEKGARLSRRLLGAMLFFVFLFTAAAVWPAISWRIRFGVWMI